MIQINLALALTCVPAVQHYLQNDNKLRRFVPIIQKSLVYPVLYDSKRTLLSLPPIINSSHSQVRPCCIQPAPFISKAREMCVVCWILHTFNGSTAPGQISCRQERHISCSRMIPVYSHLQASCSGDCREKAGAIGCVVMALLLTTE